MTGAAAQKKDVVYALADNIASLRYEDIPRETVELTKLDILDTLGVSIAASGAATLCKKVVELVRDMGGKPESTIVGYGDKVPAPWASFANASLAHALNYDDLNDDISVHISCSVFPAAFAAAERAGKVSGKELITAYALAVDTQSRLARALACGDNPTDWMLYGWLLPQLFGYHGATVAASRVLGLNRDQIVSALGLAYSQVGGVMQTNISAGSDKGVYPGHPAHAGVLSALMAQKGIAGPPESLEGKAGLYTVYFRGLYDRSAITANLGKQFETPGFYPVPCCSQTQPFIETALRMVEEHKIRSADVEAVTLFVGARGQALCEPLPVRRNPRMMSEAQYSIPFTVAVAIAKGKPRVKHFADDGLKDTEVLRLSNCTTWQLDPGCNIRYGKPGQPARMEIKLRNGRVLSSGQTGPRYGHTQRPIGRQELTDKFRECAGYALKPLAAGKVEGLIKTIGNLEEVKDVGSIIQSVS